MKISVRIPAACYSAALADLDRPHPFAAERIGFFSTAQGKAGRDECVVCVTRYHPIPDTHYVNDPFVGARINSQAIRAALQRILDEKSGQLHVHLHWHVGRPHPSRTDREELPPLVQSMCATAGDQVHGGLILSRDGAFADLWLPGQAEPKPAARVTVVGFPMRFLQ